MKLLAEMVFYNPQLFLIHHGPLLVWILLRVYQNLKNMMLCLQWQTDLLSLFISSHLSHPYTAANVATLFMQHIFKLHEMPTSIVSDKDPIFTSKFQVELFRLQGVQLAMSSAYYPQSNGQIDVVNKSLEQYLRAIARDKTK